MAEAFSPSTSAIAPRIFTTCTISVQDLECHASFMPDILLSNRSAPAAATAVASAGPPYASRRSLRPRSHVNGPLRRPATIFESALRHLWASSCREASDFTGGSLARVDRYVFLTSTLLFLTKTNHSGVNMGYNIVKLQGKGPLHANSPLESASDSHPAPHSPHSTRDPSDKPASGGSGEGKRRKASFRPHLGTQNSRFPLDSGPFQRAYMISWLESRCRCSCIPRIFAGLSSFNWPWRIWRLWSP